MRGAPRWKILGLGLLALGLLVAALWLPDQPSHMVRDTGRQPRTPSPAVALTQNGSFSTTVLTVLVLDALVRVPIAGASVAFSQDATEHDGHSCVTGSEGKAVIDLRSPTSGSNSNVLVGWVRIRATGYADETIEQISLPRGTPSQRLVLLHGACRLIGRVRDGATDEPIPAADLTLCPSTQDADPMTFRKATSKADGSFEFTGLPPNMSFRLLAWGLGFGAAQVTPLTASPSPEPTIVTLRRHHGVLLRLPDVTDPPLCGHLRIIASFGGVAGVPMPVRWSDQLHCAVATLPWEKDQGHIWIRLVGDLGETIGSADWAQDYEGSLELRTDIQSYTLSLTFPQGAFADSPMPEFISWKSSQDMGTTELPSDRRLTVLYSAKQGTYTVDLFVADLVAHAVRLPGDTDAVFVAREPGTLVVIDCPEQERELRIWRVIGPSDVDAPVTVRIDGQHCETSLPPGRYRVGLGGVPCEDIIRIESGGVVTVSLREMTQYGSLEVRPMAQGQRSYVTPAEIRILGILADRAQTKTIGQCLIGGTTVFSNLRSGTYEVVARHREIGEARARVSLRVMQKSSVTLSEWTAPCLQKFIVVDLNGTPCVGRTLCIERLPSGSGENVQVSTDSDGRCSCILTGTGKFIVRLTTAAVVRRIIPETTEISLVLPEGRTTDVLCNGWWSDRVQKVRLIDTSADGVYYCIADRVADNRFRLPIPKSPGASLVVTIPGQPNVFLTGGLRERAGAIELSDPPPKCTLQVRVADTPPSPSSQDIARLWLDVRAVGGHDISDVMVASSLVGVDPSLDRDLELQGYGGLRLRALGSGLDGLVRWESNEVDLLAGESSVTITLRGTSK